jgi:hypothetical protein
VQLTNAQLDTLKAWLAVNANGQQDEQAAALLNATAAGPNNVVWKSNVPLAAVARNLNGTELAGLTTANHTRLQTVVTLISAVGGVDASDADQRAFWDDIFSGAGGVTTRANLLALWKRTIRVGENLFKTGTGSDASPATLGVFSAVNGLTVYCEGEVTPANVSNARNRP